MRILILGDVVGRPGRRAVQELVPALVKQEQIDLAIANAENAAGGMGVDVKSAGELFSARVFTCSPSGITSGKRRRSIAYSGGSFQFASTRPISREGAPGRGWCEWRGGNGLRALIINLQGRVFMPNHVDDPFRCVDRLLKQHGQHSRVVIVDMHAEATSEKNAMGWHLAGRVSAVYGTHTHIQTADERILPNGTAFITDVGMCGPFDSVIGIEKDTVINGFLKPAAAQIRSCAGERRAPGGYS